MSDVARRRSTEKEIAEGYARIQTRLADLAGLLRAWEGDGPEAPIPIASFKVARANFEGTYWMRLAKACEWNLSRMAHVSGHPRSTVRSYVARYAPALLSTLPEEALGGWTTRPRRRVSRTSMTSVPKRAEEFCKELLRDIACVEEKRARLEKHGRDAPSVAAATRKRSAEKRTGTRRRSVEPVRGRAPTPTKPKQLWRSRVLGVLSAAPDVTFTPTGLASALGLPSRTVREALGYLIDNALIRRVGHGEYQALSA